MTILDAIEIPELDITVTEVVEDCFYYKMALLGRISHEQGELTENRLRGKYDKDTLEKAFATADRMINNIDEYGVPCISMM